MNLSFIIIRAVLGIVFFVVGILLSRGVQPPRAESRGIPLLFDNPYLLQTLIALTSGVLGVFALPFLFEKIRVWFESLIRATVAKSLAEWSKQVGKQVGKAIATRRPTPKPPKSSKHPTTPMTPATPVILDTSAIIDGRLLDIIKTGFLDMPLVVPQFVLDELQHLADSHDDLKRQRGRRGLELLGEMKKGEGIRLDVVAGVTEFNSLSGRNDVDKHLVQMAKKLKAKIATVDYNLNKAASVSGIKVLNVNELANSVKTTVLPGEKLSIKVVQKGKEAAQGVGYLEDGTMVVVEDGVGLVGKGVEVEVSRVLQTAAGRMVFAKLQG